VVVAHMDETVGGSESGTMGAMGGVATMRCTQSGMSPGARAHGGAVAIGWVGHFAVQV
jgi:hypothetical protein